MSHAPLEQAIAERLALWDRERVAERLWAKDGSLWAASGKPADEVAGWLGWLDLRSQPNIRRPCSMPNFSVTAPGPCSVMAACRRM